MQKINVLLSAGLLVVALLVTTNTWAQTATPTKSMTKEQYVKMLKDNQAAAMQRRAERAAQPRKAKAPQPAATAANVDPALKAKKEAARMANAQLSVVQQPVSKQVVTTPPVQPFTMTEADVNYRTALGKATTTTEKKGILQQWIANTKNTTLKAGLQARLTRLNQQ